MDKETADRDSDSETSKRATRPHTDSSSPLRERRLPASEVFDLRVISEEDADDSSATHSYCHTSSHSYCA